MERVDDALNATRAAIQEGVVVGGGLALINASKVIKDNYKLTDEVGASIVYKALRRPAIQIAGNAGISSYEFELAISNSSVENYGLDASTGVFLNLLEAGIIDPVKVTRSALEAAGSIASMVLTTEVLVAERRDENDNRSELE